MSVAEEEKRNGLPQSVQNNLKTLVEGRSNGVWGSDLEDLYKNEFKKPLEYFDYGYGSVLHMCASLTHLFKLAKHMKGDFKIYDLKTNIPKEIVTAEDLKLKSCVMQYNESIDRYRAPAGNTRFNIKISQTYDPSKFWFHLAHTEKLLNALMEKIQSFYQSSAKCYQIPSHQLQEGLYCIAITEGEFHRGVIVDILPVLMHSVKIYFIDYGSTDIINVTKVYFLHELFKDSPAFALRGQLSLAKPIGTNMPWSTDAANTFYTFAYGNLVSAQINSTFIENGTLVYCLSLYNKMTNESIVDTLIFMNQAIDENSNQDEFKSIPAFVDKTQMMHLVPTFTELEKGSAPNRRELNIMLNMSYPLEMIYAKYLN